jgi:dipeptidyl aminopeptidase
MPVEKRIIQEVNWLGDEDLLVKEVDRSAKQGNVVLFTKGQSHGRLVRSLGRDGEEGDDGWIENVSRYRILLETGH